MANRIDFCKMQGTGNDFLIFNASDESIFSRLQSVFSAGNRAELIRRLCDRHFGIGADGVVFLRPANQPDADLQWDFYNSDGSKAEMCGNVARCVGLYAINELGCQKKIRVMTLAGLIQVEVRSIDEIQVEMTRPTLVQSGVEFAVKSRTMQADWIDTGVPHVVIPISAAERPQSYIEDARVIRRDPVLGPGGANVTFYSALADGRGVRSATYERGVEDFTLACGTGAVAAAFAFRYQKFVKQTRVEVPGGILNIEFNPEMSEARLIGPARVVYSGTI